MSSQDSDNTSGAKAADGNGAKDPRKRRRMLIVAVVVFLLAGATWVLLWLLVFSHREETDDAYVGGNQVGISAQVPGIVVGVFADDTQRVKTGQVLVRLDPTDADVNLRKAASGLAQAVRQVRQQTQSAASADAALGTRSQDLKRAQEDLKRRIPLPVLSRWSIASASRPAVRRRCSTSAGSTSPLRVPITSPSSGVSPIDVSTLRPPAIAAALAPLPRCRTIRSVSPSGRPRCSAAARDTYAWEVPWKP